MTRGFKLIACILCAIAVHAVIFVATAAGLRAANAALKHDGSADVGAVEWSHRYYYDYASEALSGKIPYRDFAFEYPVLSYPLFLIPRLLVSDFESYRYAFVAEMFLLDVAAIVLIARHGGAGEETETVARHLGWYTLYCLLLAPLVIGRFELAPMVLAFAATCWWFSGRPIRGGITAGLGTLMKIFPGVVAAPALVWEAARLRTTRARGTAAFLVTLVVGLAFWFGLGGRRVLEPLGYHAGRGLEIESLFGAALFLAGTISGSKAPWVFDHNAYHLSSEWGARLALLTFPVQATALLVVMWAYRQSGMADGLRFSAAAVLAFIVFGKVLSPQYMIWLFPFMAVLGGRTGSVARQIFLMVCVTTAMIYPGPGFSMVLDHQAGAMLLLNLRNGLLLWLLAMLIYCPAEELGPKSHPSDMPAQVAPDMPAQVAP
jgi:glycosyl transferase family 87